MKYKRRVNRQDAKNAKVRIENAGWVVIDERRRDRIGFADCLPKDER
jgi:hypothetical protein